MLDTQKAIRQNRSVDNKREEMMTIYIEHYGEGDYPSLLTFDDLQFTTDPNGKGIRVSQVMNESEFLDLLANTRDGSIPCFYPNTSVSAGLKCGPYNIDYGLWWLSHINVYDENDFMWEKHEQHYDFFEMEN